MTFNYLRVCGTSGGALLEQQKQMFKLVVGALVSVVEISRVEWVRASERVVDLRLLCLPLAQPVAFFVTVHQTCFIIIVLVLVRLSIDTRVFIAATADAASVAVIVDVCRVDLFVALNELVHFLLLIIIDDTATALGGGLLHFLLQHHYLILLVCVLVLVVGIHVQPAVIKHLLSSSTLMRVPLEHREKEVAKGLSLLLLDAILLHQNFLQRPIVEARNASQVPGRVEVLLGVFSRESHILWHAPEKLHHLCEVVIVLVVVVALTWLKQEVSSDHLEDSASQRPNIGRCIVVTTNDNLW